jgi:hypothetical protein
MKAEFLGNMEATHQAGRQPGQSLALHRLHCRWQHHLLAAVKVVDQQERYEGQNQ